VGPSRDLLEKLPNLAWEIDFAGTFFALIDEDEVCCQGKIKNK